MAKELPYFKFYVSEWNDGSITLCSLEAQGLFINICSLYWSRSGDLTLTQVQRKYRAPDLVRELLNEGPLREKGGQIVIEFLDEQLAARIKLSEQNRKNVQNRYNRTTEQPTTVDPDVYNKEEKRREEKREEENTISLFDKKLREKTLSPFDKKLRDQIANFFKITEINQARLWFKLTAFINENRTEYIVKQFKGYSEEKADGKFLHSLDNWIGERPEWAGAWNAKEYTATSAQVYKRPAAMRSEPQTQEEFEALQREVYGDLRKK